jgi:RNA polymerase sigma-32 factor
VDIDPDVATGELPELPAPLRPNAVLFQPSAPARRPGESTLQYYVRWARGAPMLSPEDERGAAVAFYEHGDRDAANRLVSSHMRLVLKIAMQYQRRWADIVDLVQEGSLGLVHALSHFDPYRGVPFSAYARHWIRAMILRFLVDNYHLVKFGSTRAGRKLFFELERERNRMTAEGVEPTPQLLSERLGVSQDDIQKYDQVRAGAASLDAPSEGSETERTLGEILPDPGDTSPERDAARRQLNGRVQDALQRFGATLTADRDKVLWERRLLAQDQASLADLGREYNVSRERMRQIEERLKKRLKVFLENEFGDAVSFEFDGD